MSELILQGARRAGRILVGVMMVLLARMGDPMLWQVLCDACAGMRIWLALFLNNEKMRSLAQWRT